MDQNFENKSNPNNDAQPFFPLITTTQLIVDPNSDGT